MWLLLRRHDTFSSMLISCLSVYLFIYLFIYGTGCRREIYLPPTSWEENGAAEPESRC